jgi:membrane-bound metal-dependent hydrolase YbcI (DUF457 family)
LTAPGRLRQAACAPREAVVVLSGLHFLTHIALSWIVANVVTGPRRDRCLVVLAGTALDLDGIGILWSESAYLAVHRAVGHSLLFGLLMVVIAVLAAQRRWTTGVLAAAAFLLHLLLDVVGTGGLPIKLAWPVSDWSWSYDGRWTLGSWPNAVVMVVTLLGVVVVARWTGRTPLECLSRRADTALVRRARLLGSSAREGAPPVASPPE